MSPLASAGCRLGLVLLVAGCGSEPAPSRTEDLRTYAALAGSSDPSACSGIRDDSLRGECTSMAAAALAARDPAAAEAACAAMTAGFWQDECWFLVADAAGSRGADVARRCGEAGRLRNQCLAHAFDRELAESRAELAGEGMAALEAALAERFAAFVPAPRAERAARVMVAGQLSEQAPGEPFDVAHCGEVQAETCRDAFVLRVETAVTRGVCLGRPDPGCAPAALAPVCGAASPTPQAAAEAGLPTWTEALDPLAQEAWQRLCDPRRPPLSQGAPGAGP